MNVRQLEYFVNAAHEGSFARAAEIAHIGRAALSQQIRHLELELGVTLFERTAHSVELSRDGEILISGARQVLARRREFVEMARHVSEGRLGVVRVNEVSHGLGSLHDDVDRALFETLPHVEVRWSRTAWLDPFATLLSHAADICFIRRSDNAPPGVSIGRACLAEARLLAVSARNGLAALDDVAIDDLPAGLPILGCGVADRRGDLWGLWPLDLTAHRPTVSVPDSATLLTKVALDEGVGLVPQGFAADYRHPRVVYRTFLDAPASFLSPVRRNDDSDAAVRAVLEVIARTCSKRPDAGGQQWYAEARSPAGG